MTTNWSNRRGQQIADYAMVLGTVATVFISSQMVISHRVARVVADAGVTILGTNLPLEETERPPLGGSATCRPNHACSQVQETGTSGFFRTLVHAESTGSMHSGFVMAEVPGPYLGPMFAFVRGEASDVAIAVQLCGEACQDLEFGGLTKDEEGWVTVAFRDANGEKKIAFRQKDFFRDVNGLWHADIEFLGEDGQVHEALFLGAPESEWQRLADYLQGDFLRASNGIIVDQLSAQLGSLWEWMEQMNEGYNEKPPDMWFIDDLVGFFWGQDHQDDPIEGTLEELGGVTVADFLERLDEFIAANEEGLRNKDAPIRANLRHSGLSEEEAVAALSGYLSQEVFARELIRTISEALGVDPKTTSASALPGMLKNLSQQKFKELGEALEPLLNDQQVLGAAFGMVERAKMVQAAVGWDRYAGDQLFADNQTAGDYREDQQTIQSQGNDLLNFLRGPLQEARVERETELRDSGIYSEQQIQQMLKEEYDQPAAEIEGLVLQAFQEGGITVSNHHHGVPTYDEEGNYVGASWEPEPVRGEGTHPLGDGEAETRTRSAAGTLDAAYTTVVQEFVCQYDCAVSLGEGHELVDYDQLMNAALDPRAEQTGRPVVVDFGGGNEKAFDGNTVSDLPTMDDFTFISDDTRRLLEQEGPGGALRQQIFGSEQGYQDFLASLNSPPGDTTPPIAPFPTLEQLPQTPSEADALLQTYLRDQPLGGPHGLPIDVAVGGEYDVLTDMVRKAGGSAEQIIWRRADVPEDEGGDVYGLIGQVPQGRPVGITQREDQMISPIEMDMTGRVPHPSDVPEGSHLPWATYPEDTLLMRTNPDAVLPEGVGSRGSGSSVGTGGRTDPSFGQLLDGP